MKTPSSPRKKVLFLITKATSGGAQKYIYDLATNLPQEQFEPIVAYGTPGRLSSELTERGIPLYRLSSLGRDIALLSDIRSFLEIWRCLRVVQPDIVHLNSSKAAGLGALAARIAGVPTVIFTVHGWPFKERRNVIARIVIYAISWLTALMSNAVIVVSKADESIGKNMPIPGKKVHYIELGVFPMEFLSREEASSALQIRTKDTRIVTIAELTPNKGVRYALLAISTLKEQGLRVSYTIIGEGEERKELEELARSLGIAEAVRFVGHLPIAAWYLKAFDVFLLPSIKEGAPYVLIEAGLAKLPIVMTTAANIEIAERFPSVRVVPSGNADALASALKETMEDRNEEELFPEKTPFPLEKMVERTTELYRGERPLSENAD